MSAIELNEEQLASARAKAWHQDGEAILTLEAAREWVASLGLVLFAPRPQFPLAGSFVEATLGAANANPTAAALETARGLVARLVAEGTALPLNLLGGVTETPDFVVSAQVFSYVFTLRGDKAWKQPPSTSGAVKVSPLGLRVFEVLTERGALTAPELANELGREVTEVAIVRSLAELWAQMRVLPLVQQNGESTLWELSTRRFTKTIKAGANAGLPTALSAVVSLYLAQVVAATEDDIATFLSPLTARSRVREVLNALTGARQLETVVVDGKTLVHLPGGLPVAAVEPAAEGEEGAIEGVAAAAIPAPKKIGTGRIQRFDADKTDDLRGKPVKKFAAGKPAFGAKPAGKFGAKPAGKFGAKPAGKFGAKPGGRTFAAKPGGFKPTKRVAAGAELPSDRERRPFNKAAVEAPVFDKPWDEEKASKPKSAPEAFSKFRKPAPEDRPPLGPREQAGLPEDKRTAPKASFDRAPKAEGFVKRPYKPREGGTRPFVKKAFGASEGGARGSFKPKFGASTGGFGAKRAYTPREGAAEGGERPYAKKPYEKKPYAARSAEGGARPYVKKPYAPRGDGDSKPSFGKPKFGAAKPGGFAAKRPYTPREGAAEGGARSFEKKPFEKKPYEKKPYERKPFVPRSAEGGETPFAKKPFRPRAEGEGFKPRFDRASKPGGFAGKPRFGGSRSGGGFRSRPELIPMPVPEGERMFEKKPYKPRAADAHKRPYTKDEWVPGPDDAPKKRSGGKFGGKPAGKFGGKKFGGKPAFKGKPGGGPKRPRPAAGE
ncbi:MAG: hypothetical protein V4555_06560 [Acidobacteriota bacterium]